jgi:DNA mismatch repair protein PMS2
MIRAIDRSSVQKICSGQVVVDLATAVKEMVENALDSGGTCIEVRLTEMGANMIEVSDNGSGIDPTNYSGIAMKHFTSKLQQFEDIYSVSSFGFRGEALNALCELSERFSVTTKQDSQLTGTLLQFGHSGR